MIKLWHRIRKRQFLWKFSPRKTIQERKPYLVKNEYLTLPYSTHLINFFYLQILRNELCSQQGLTVLHPLVLLQPFKPVKSSYKQAHQSNNTDSSHKNRGFIKLIPPFVVRLGVLLITYSAAGDFGRHLPFVESVTRFWFHVLVASSKIFRESFWFRQCFVPSRFAIVSLLFRSKATLVVKHGCKKWHSEKKIYFLIFFWLPSIIFYRKTRFVLLIPTLNVDYQTRLFSVEVETSEFWIDFC